MVLEKKIAGLVRAFALASILSASALVPSATAQTASAKTITMVVAFPPGGSANIVARILADKLGEALGQPIVIDNRGGAGGTIGMRMVAKGPTDGSMISLVNTGTLGIGPSLYSNAGFDPRKDFAPVGRIGVAPTTLVVHPSYPARTVAALIADAKSNPGKINFGSAGVGTVGHVAGEFFAIEAGIKLTHIPYKGTGPMMTDLLGGHIRTAFAPLPAVRENVKNGNLVMLGITTEKRSPLMPDVPTIAEAALPGYSAVLHYGLIAPAGTPASVVARLNAALNTAMASDEVRKRLETEGLEPESSTPAAYGGDIDREETKWSKVVKSLGIQAAE